MASRTSSSSSSTHRGSPRKNVPNQPKRNEKEKELTQIMPYVFELACVCEHCLLLSFSTSIVATRTPQEAYNGPIAGPLIRLGHKQLGCTVLVPPATLIQTYTTTHTGRGKSMASTPPPPPREEAEGEDDDMEAAAAISPATATTALLSLPPSGSPSPPSTPSSTTTTTKERRHRLLLGLGLGQILSLLIAGTGIFSSLLAEQGLSLPATQACLTYILLSLHLTRRPRGQPLKVAWWKYLILAAIDFEGNYLVRKWRGREGGREGGG